MKLTENQIMALCDMLIGTCESIEQTLEDLYGVNSQDLSTESLQRIDDVMFCCQYCGWWYEQPSTEDGVCLDCEDYN